MSPETFASIILYGFLAILCITSNSLVCYLIIKRKIFHHVLKYYILSLAFTDLLVGIISIPLYVLSLSNIVTKESRYKEIYQKVYTGLDIFLGACSILHLCLMSIDRAFAITKPFWHRRYMQERRLAIKLLIYPWLTSLLCAIPTFINLYLKYYGFAMSMITFALPTFLIIMCYGCIFIAIRRRNITNAGQVNERKLLRTVLCVVIVFVTCWGPFHVFNILYSFNLLQQLSYEQMVTALNVLKWMQYFNSACNPFIYAFFHPDVRLAMKTFLNNSFRCKKEVSDSHFPPGYNNESTETVL